MQGKIQEITDKMRVGDQRGCLRRLAEMLGDVNLALFNDEWDAAKARLDEAQTALDIIRFEPEE